MKLATLILAWTLATGMALAGVTLEPHHTEKAEMARHSQALLQIEEDEIDAKAAFSKETLHCNSDSLCLKAARARYNQARKAIQARRIEEGALHQKNMAKLAPPPRPRGGCM